MPVVGILGRSGSRITKGLDDQPSILIRRLAFEQPIRGYRRASNMSIERAEIAVDSPQRLLGVDLDSEKRVEGPARAV